MKIVNTFIAMIMAFGTLFLTPFCNAASQQIINGFMDDIMKAQSTDREALLRQRYNLKPDEENYYIEYIKVSKQSPNLQAQPRPVRGMSMDTVRKRFGSPQEIFEAIGKPPITRWKYKNYTVYFEFDKVVHAVIDP